MLIGWGVLTGAASLALAVGLAVRGPEFFYLIQGPAEASRVEIKFLVFAIAWLWLGAGLALSQVPDIARRHGAFLVVLFLQGMSALNVVRGPHAVEHKDFSNYFTAARHMRLGLPLSADPFQAYLYPPLLATLIEPLVPFGLGPASWLFRFSNYAALLLFAWLLYLTLQRFGASRNLAAAMILAALAANVPVADTFASQQVNLHVANLVLASLLLFPRHELLSGALLAIGVHLKVYPVLLALAPLALRRWRWCAAFVVTGVGVLSLTSMVNSLDYYRQFIYEIGRLQEYGIRNASVTSLLHNTARFSGLNPGAFERPLATLLQWLLGAFGAWCGWRVMRDGKLATRGDLDERRFASAFAVLSIVMLLVSPSLWVHHFVLAIMPVLVLALNTRRFEDGLWLAVAWFLVFLVPVHEVFPMAYWRVAGLIIFAWRFRTAQLDDGTPGLRDLEVGVRPRSAPA